MRTCPRCGSGRIASGELRSDGRAPQFRPHGLRVPLFTLIDSTPGRIDFDHRVRACLDCGLLWTTVEPEELRDTLRRYAVRPLKEELALDDTTEVTPAAPPTGHGDELAAPE